MDLTELERHVLAHYLATSADNFSMAPRWWPYGELVLVVQDKVSVATRKFGVKAGMAAPKVARALLDLLIEREAFSTKKSDLGSVMHQFQPDTYRTMIKELQDADPIIPKAKAEGPDFWQQAFAQLR